MLKFAIRFTLFLCLTSCVQHDTNEEKKQQMKENLKAEIEDFKKTIPDTDRNPANDEWNGNVYRNRFYKFRVEFPKNWEYDRGTTKITLARALNRKYGAAISVTIKQLPDVPKNPNNIFESYPLTEFKEMFNKFLALQNTKAENFTMEQGFLNNFPAYVLEFTTRQSAGTETYVMLSKQIQCYFEGRIYQVNLNLPLQLYDDTIERYWKRVVTSFNFEIIY